MASKRRPLPSATGLFVCGLVVVAAMVPGGWWMVRTPWVGVSLEDRAPGTFVVVGVEAGSSADAFGVRPHDVLQGVGGLSPTALGSRDPAEAFDRAVKNRWAAGDSVTWHLLRGGEQVTSSGRLLALPTSLVVSHMLLYLPFLVVAGFLGWLRRDDARARRLVYVILALVAGNFLRPATDMALDTPLGFALQQLCALGRFLGPALLVQWAATFPVPTLSRTVERWLVRVAYAVPFCLFLVEEWVIVQGLLDPAAPYLLYAGTLERLDYFTIRFIVFLASVITAGLLLVRASWKASGRERNKVRWVVWSVVTVAVADTSLVVASYLLTGGYSDTILGPARNGLYMILGAGLLVAILRDDLFNVDRVIWVSSLYFITTGFAFVLFAVMEEGLSALLGTVMTTRSSFAATAVSGVLAAAAFHPVRRALDRALARRGLAPPDPEFF